MMNNTGIHTIDSDQYASEAERLMSDPTIQQMADDFAVGLNAGKITLPALQNEMGIILSAKEYAREAGVEFTFIETPARAVYNLLKDQFE